MPLLAARSQPGDLAIADLDGDGAGNVVVLHPTQLELGVYRQRPGGVLAPKERYIFGSIQAGPQELAVGDFNGDGKPDVASANFLGLYVLYHN